MRRNNILLFIMFLILLVPSVYALDWTPDVTEVLDNGFGILYDGLSQFYIQFGITTIFLIILFHNIFAAGISKVGPFGGSGSANKYGKMVAMSLSILATIGLMFLGPGGPYSMLDRILGTMGLIAALAFATAIFGITYFNLKGEEKTWSVALISTGLGMMVYGLFSDNPQWAGLGLLLLLIGLGLFLFSGNSPFGSGSRDDGTTTRRQTTDPNRVTPERGYREPGLGNGTGTGEGGYPPQVSGVWGQIIPEDSDQEMVRQQGGGTS